LKITKLKEQDLLPLGELFKQFRGEDSSLEKMRASFPRLSENPAYILLAAKKGESLVGFPMGVACEELYGDCRPFMVIEDLVVDENHRRSGTGSALMLELEKFARAKDCCQILFVTEADRTEAHQFYQSLGYPFEPRKGFKKRL